MNRGPLVALRVLGAAVLVVLAMMVGPLRRHGTGSIETEQLRPPMIYRVSPIALVPVDGVRWSQQPLAPVEGVKWTLSSPRALEEAAGVSQ
jgi:hypothetical protein